MNKIIAVIYNTDSEGTDICRLMEDRLPSTAFPGCWAAPSDDPNTARLLADTVKGFIGAEGFDRIVFGISENIADSVTELIGSEVQRIDVMRLSELMGIV